jgi:hypothetical protein
MAYQEETRVFDVSKPNRVGPSPNSRPVIVGHRPTMADPMVNADQAASEAYSYPAASSPAATPIHVAMDEDGGQGENLFGSSPEQAPELTQNPPAPEQNSAETAVEPDSQAQPENEPAESEHTEGGYISTEPLSTQPAHQNDELIAGEEIRPDSTPPPTDDSGGWQKEAAPLTAPKGAGPRRKWPKIIGWILGPILLIVASFYLAIDMGMVQSDVKLPFHIFNNQKGLVIPTAAAPAATKSAATPPPTTISTPTGFTDYKVASTNLSFAYPDVWGTPTVTTDPGFTKRGGANKSNGTYAYLVSFATNKDVELAATSSKYLPAKRTALYYDFLQWCNGTNDSKVYKQTLHFNTDAGTETPGTITCDQGPLADATKLDNLTIVQSKTKDAAGKDLGDLYSQNLTDADLQVLRVRDTKMTNADDIKKLLATVKVTASNP